MIRNLIAILCLTLLANCAAPCKPVDGGIGGTGSCASAPIVN